MICWDRWLSIVLLEFIGFTIQGMADMLINLNMDFVNDKPPHRLLAASFAVTRVGTSSPNLPFGRKRGTQTWRLFASSKCLSSFLAKSWTSDGREKEQRKIVEKIGEADHLNGPIYTTILARLGPALINRAIRYISKEYF